MDDDGYVEVNSGSNNATAFTNPAYDSTSGAYESDWPGHNVGSRRGDPVQAEAVGGSGGMTNAKKLLLGGIVSAHIIYDCA
jgi:hypothetical protein